jgi:hypothetical protein
MQRRLFVIAGSAGVLMPARAHHGWSSFDTERPLYLEGTARSVAWRNPHVELQLELPPTLRLPEGLKTLPVPRQSTEVDAAGILARTALPTRKDRRWTVELAPLTRMQAWKVDEIKPGASLAVIGYTFAGEKGEPVLRAEYLFVNAQAYGLRSSPA